MSGDLVARLTRVLDEDERVALAIHHDYCDSVVRHVDRNHVVWQVGPCNCGWPARTLRVVAAHRTILKSYEDACERVRNPVSADARTAARAAQFELEEVIRALAEAYGVTVGETP